MEVRIIRDILTVIILMLMILIGGYAVGLVMGVGNVLLYSFSSLSGEHLHTIGNIAIYYIIFNVVISALIFYFIIDIVTAIRAR